MSSSPILSHKKDYVCFKRFHSHYCVVCKKNYDCSRIVVEHRGTPSNRYFEMANQCAVQKDTICEKCYRQNPDQEFLPNQVIEKKVF